MSTAKSRSIGRRDAPARKAALGRQSVWIAAAWLTLKTAPAKALVFLLPLLPALIFPAIIGTAAAIIYANRDSGPEPRPPTPETKQEDAGKPVTPTEQPAPEPPRAEEKLPGSWLIPPWSQRPVPQQQADSGQTLCAVE